MPKAVSATEAKVEPGTLLEWTTTRDEVIIESRGRQPRGEERGSLGGRRAWSGRPRGSRCSRSAGAPRHAPLPEAIASARSLGCQSVPDLPPLHKPRTRPSITDALRPSDIEFTQISTGNVIGFLMEAHERGMIDRKFLDGIDLRWGNVDATLAMIEKIAARDGGGDLAADGVRALSSRIGQGSEKFAIQVKGLELAAHNIQANQPRGLSFATAARGRAP